jgi:hypothetical protein
MTHPSGYRRILHKMGYYNYHSAFISRTVNQEGGWDSHLNKSRKFILKAVQIYKPDKITVLGSGWLLELPINELLDKVEKVTLVDIIHPPDVIEQVSSIRNVELVEADISGGLIEKAWEISRMHSFLNKLKSFDEIIVPEYKFPNDPGLVISLNILTQLEIRLLVLLKKISSAGEEEYITLRQKIQDSHLNLLIKHNSVLISDYEEVFSDRKGNTNSVPTILTKLPEGRVREEWTWNFEQTDSYKYNSRSIMKVVGLMI